MGGSGTRIVIELLQGGAEPKGEVSVGGEPRLQFAGWIGLISALESVVCPQPSAVSSHTAEDPLPPGQIARG